MTPQKTSEIAGTSQGLFQPSGHQKLHLPQRGTQRFVPNHEPSSSSCQSNSTPRPNHSAHYQGSIHQKSIQKSSTAPCTNLQTSHVASTYMNTDPKLRSHSHSYPTPSEHLHKPQQSSTQTPHPNLVHQRAGQQQPQINSSCSSSQNTCKEVEFKK